MSSENVKYLKFWWDPNSTLDPAQSTTDYFKVAYDELGQYTWVERHNASQQLLSRDRFHWKDHIVLKVDIYDAETNTIKKYIEWEYDKKGEPRARNHYSPEGKLLRREKIE